MTSAGETRTPQRRRGLFITLFVIGVLGVGLLTAAAWLFSRVEVVRTELTMVIPMADTIREQAAAGDTGGLAETVDTIAGHTSAAAAASADPVWLASEWVPFIGANLRAVREAASVADDVVSNVGLPLADVASVLTPETMLRDDYTIDVGLLRTAQATIGDATGEIESISDRAEAMSSDGVIPEIADAVESLKRIVGEAVSALRTYSAVAELGTSMLGGDESRSYLVLIMNNAELRSQGGMPGSIARVSVDDGKLVLEGTASTTDFDPIPPEPVVQPTEWETVLYSSDIGRRLQDVTATPEFTNTAKYASALAEPVFGAPSDGVLAVDPYTLAYMLEATGPIALIDGRQLDAANAPDLLLREVYFRYPEQADQDAFFDSVIESIIGQVAAGDFDPKAMIGALGRSLEERRIKLWSAREGEQELIRELPVAGSLPSTDGAHLGLYANDWTRSKMDSYLKIGATVTQTECRDGRRTATVDYVLRNELAGADVAGLPEYLSGDGKRVPKGSISTHLMVVGPEGSTIDAIVAPESGEVRPTADVDGRGGGSAIVALTPGAQTNVTFTVTWPEEAGALEGVTVTPQLSYDLAEPTAQCGT